MNYVHHGAHSTNKFTLYRGITTSVKEAACLGGDTKGLEVGPEELMGAAWGGLEALPEEDCLACS